MYSDENNLAYLLFIQPILNEFQRKIKVFESNTADKVIPLDMLLMLYKSIKKKLITPTCKIDLLACDVESYLDPIPYCYGQHNKGCLKIKTFCQMCPYFVNYSVFQPVKDLPKYSQIMKFFTLFFANNSLTECQIKL